MAAQRWSLALNVLTAQRADQAVRTAAAAGYAAVEVLADLPHLWPLGADARSTEAAVQRALRDTGLAVANVNANTVAGFHGGFAEDPRFEPSLAHPDPAERARRRDHAAASLAVAARLGAPSVSVTAGRPRAPLPAARDRLAAALHDLAAEAEGWRVRVGVEAEPGLLVETGRELQELLDRVGSPWLGANLDVVHAHALGEDPAALAVELGPRIVHVHLADAPPGKHLHLLPGDGALPLRSVLDALGRAAYRGALTVEIYPYAHDGPAAAARALAGLRALAGDGTARGAEDAPKEAPGEAPKEAAA